MVATPSLDALAEKIADDIIDGTREEPRPSPSTPEERA